MAPSFSKIPSVTMNRLVRGPRRYLRSFSTLRSTSSRLLRSLWSNQRTVILNRKIDAVGNNDVGTFCEYFKPDRDNMYHRDALALAYTHPVQYPKYESIQNEKYEGAYSLEGHSRVLYWAMVKSFLHKNLISVSASCTYTIANKFAQGRSFKLP
jgi:hypothetical protein